MKRKKLFSAMCIFAMVFSLTACGSTAEETKEKDGNESSAGDEVTLRFSWWGGDSRHQATLDVIELYEMQTQFEAFADLSQFDDILNTDGSAVA